MPDRRLPRGKCIRHPHTGPHIPFNSSRQDYSNTTAIVALQAGSQAAKSEVYCILCTLKVKKHIGKEIKQSYDLTCVTNAGEKLGFEGLRNVGHALFVQNIACLLQSPEAFL